MGLPMAKNLVAAGFSVIGYNRSPQKAAALAEAGGEAADTIVEAVTGADVIITMLPDAPDVIEVVCGEGGVLSAAREGAVLIDMSTIAPASAQVVADAAGAAGLRVLDAPVSGGEAGAVEGVLSVMVGGDAEVLDEVGPVLDAVGATIVHVGPAGAGQTVKAANQLIVAGTIQLVSEALTLLSASGVELESAVSVLAGGLAGNRILDRKAASMIRHDFTPGFRVDLHVKDMGIVMDTARSTGVVIPLGALAAQLMTSLQAQGHGDLDHSALLLGVEQLSGRAES